MALRLAVKGGLVLTSGRVSGALFGLARNIAIARLISVENFGIAATFAIIIGIVETAADLGVDRMLIQAKDGENPRLQGNAQFVNVMRGLISGVVLYFCAGPIAQLFGIPHVTWAFELLALMPFLNSFLHMDVARAQRKFNFLPAAATLFIPQLVALLLAVPFCLYFDDFRAALAASFCQVLMYVVVSHVIATRKYRWSLDKGLTKRILKFGWPLVMNGIVVSLVAQGDRTIVGIYFSVEDLARFSVAFSLVFLVTSILFSIIQSYFLPIVSAVADIPAKLEQRAVTVVQTSALLGLALALGYALGGSALLSLLYGSKYHVANTIIILLALTQGIRLARNGLSTVSLATRHTALPLLSSIARILWFSVSAYLAAHGGSVEDILYVAVAGEVSAYLVGFIALRVYAKINLNKSAISLILFLLILGMGVAISKYYFGHHHVLLELSAAVMIVCGVFGVIVLVMKDFRERFLSMLKSVG